MFSDNNKRKSLKEQASIEFEKFAERRETFFELKFGEELIPTENLYTYLNGIYNRNLKPESYKITKVLFTGRQLNVFRKKQETNTNWPMLDYIMKVDIEIVLNEEDKNLNSENFSNTYYFTEFLDIRVLMWLFKTINEKD